MSSKFSADKVAPDVVVRYERELGVAEEEMQGFLRERKEIEEQIRGLQKRLPEIELRMEKIELDVQTGGRRVAEAEKRLAELQ
jgi:structural maintenance of chromosome 4